MYDRRFCRKLPILAYESCPIPLARGGLGRGKWTTQGFQQTCAYTVALKKGIGYFQNILLLRNSLDEIHYSIVQS
jgi:hypothetical protein